MSQSTKQIRQPVFSLRPSRGLNHSVGYATCHWCHVMEEESFEDEEIARFLNENFVCIKVDREERPDIDAIYMTAVQAMVSRSDNRIPGKEILQKAAAFYRKNYDPRFGGLSGAPNFEGRYIFHTPKKRKEIATELHMSENDLTAVIDTSKKQLLRKRNKRPAPLRDEKILTAWNALMISAFARAGAEKSVCTG